MSVLNRGRRIKKEVVGQPLNCYYWTACIKAYRQYSKKVKEMTILACCALVFFLGIPVSLEGVMLGEGEWWNNWEVIEKGEYRLTVNMVGSGAFYPGDNYLVGGIPTISFAVKQESGIKNSLSDLGCGKGGWQEIKGERKETNKGTEIILKGVIKGMDVEETILAADDTVTVKTNVIMASPSTNLACVFFEAGFHRRPGGVPFRAETEDGIQVSGDFCQPFENIKSIKWLEVKTTQKSIRYEFPEASMVALNRIYYPDDPNYPAVACIYLCPRGIEPYTSPQPGNEFGFTMTIKISPLKEKTVLLKSLKNFLASDVFAEELPEDNPFYRWNAEVIYLSGKGVNTEKVYYRKSFVLSSEVRSAQLCFTPLVNTIVYLNGKKIASSSPIAHTQLEVVDVPSDYFRNDKNNLAIEGEKMRMPMLTPFDFALEGIIKFKNGEFIRIFTDKSWKCDYQLHKSWNETEFDDSTWQFVSSKGNITKTDYPAHGEYGGGLFLGPPYLGPIEIELQNRNEPIFKENESPSFLIKLPKKEIKPNIYSLEYQVSDSFSKEVIKKGEVKKPKISTYDYTYTLSFSSLPSSAYNLSIQVKERDKLVDRRIYEFVVIGKIRQREVPAEDLFKETKKRLLKSIDCGDKEQKFLSGPREDVSTIKEGPLEKYREIANIVYDFISYHFKVENLYQPHLIEVDYLDDRECGFEIRISENFIPYYKNITNFGTKNLALVRTSRGVYLGPPYPLTRKIQTQNLLYFPNYSDATVDILTIIDIGKPAIKAIRIYEILDLPAAKIAHPDEGRLIGNYFERASLIPNMFYGGEEGAVFQHHLMGEAHHGFYKAWYKTIENAIRYAKFTGQNLYLPGFWMYDAPHYPTKISQTYVTPRKDYFDLLLQMFEENNIYLIAGIEFMGTPEIWAAKKFTDKEVEKGADTILQVSNEGKQMYLNFMHPIVEKNFLMLVDDIVNRYKGYKSFAGIGLLSFDGTPGFGYNNLDCSYDDYTIGLFVKETGIIIPVAETDPERFEKRCTWLMQNAKEKWIDWRCLKNYQLHEKIYKTIQEANPNLTYYPFRYPDNSYDWGTSGKDLREILKEKGFDPLLYKGKNKPVLSWCYASSFGLGNVRDPIPGVISSFNFSPEVNSLFDNKENTASFIFAGWHAEPLIFVPEEEKNWYWGSSFACPNFFPGHRYFLDDFTSRLIYSTPRLITYPFSDVQLPSGSEDELAKFISSFRAIPSGEYNTLTGNELDKNIVVRQMKNRKGKYFYILNPDWWQVSVELKFDIACQEVVDLVSGEKIKVKDGILPLTLSSYEIRPFEVLPGKSNLLSATISIDKEGKAHLDGKINILSYTNRLDQAELKRIITEVLSFNYEMTMNMMEEVKKSYREGNYTKTERCLQAPEMRPLLSYLAQWKQAAEKGDVQLANNYMVNCASYEYYIDHKGNTWLPDQEYKYGLIEKWGYLGGGTIDRGNIKIKNTENPRIYQTERYDLKGYRFKVPNGFYTVRLHFAETFAPGEKRRVFDIIIQGKQVLKDLDIFAEAGMEAALLKEFKDISVENKELEINFFPVGLSEINGIEVIKQ